MTERQDEGGCVTALIIMAITVFILFVGFIALVDISTRDRDYEARLRVIERKLGITPPPLKQERWKLLPEIKRIEP